MGSRRFRDRSGGKYKKSSDIPVPVEKQERPINNVQLESLALFEVPKINESNIRYLAINRDSVGDFFAEPFMDIFPLDSSKGIFLMRTKDKGYHGKNNKIKVRLVVVDVEPQVVDMETGIDFQEVKLRLISTGEEFSLDKFAMNISVGDLESLLVRLSPKNMEFTRNLKVGTPLNEFQQVMEVLRHFPQIEGNVSKINYARGKVKVDSGVNITVIHPRLFYDFLRCRFENPEITFEDYMRPIIEKNYGRGSL